MKTLSLLVIPLLFLPLFVKSSLNAKRYFTGDTRTSLYYWLDENRDLKEVAIHNDKTLSDIFTYLNMKSSKTLDSFKIYDKALIVLYEPDEEERAFIEKNESIFEEVARFSSKGKLGSDIEVYRYSKPIPVPTVSGGCGCGN